jgi:hypothetical protein
MKISRTALLIAALMLPAAPAIASGKSKSATTACIKGKVLSAFQMRMLQTELVVSALSCKLTPRYNEFVTAYRSDLMSAHRTLMSHFSRESRLEDYKSRTANEVSQRSLANITEFCTYTTSLYDKLLGPEKIRLVEFVSNEPSANRHGQNACGTPSIITASSGGRLIPMPRMKPEQPAAAATAPAAQ